MKMQEQAPRLSCDTLVAFSDEGQERQVIFAKNSDRPWNETQPLEYVPSATHAPGSTVRCQLLTIPQAEHTLAVIGGRPWWLWGYEQGLNEAGVAIGNEAIYTRDEVPSVGLLGMDLVRLGLERGQNAAAATEVIAEHVERYGQGGSGVYPNDPQLGDFRYHNSFMIADADEAFVLESSGHRWVSRRVVSSIAIANLLTIGDDWDQASLDVEEHARNQGWWNEPFDVRFDFRSAYEDRAMRANTEARYAQSCRFLERGEVSLESMMRHLRDHFEGGTIHIHDSKAQVTRPRSICLHPELWANGTTASMVVDLTAARRLPVAWVSMASPCTSVFVPVPVGEQLPTPWSIGSENPDPRSLWWLMHELAEAVQRDYALLTPIVQAEWLGWESDLIAETYANPDSVWGKLEERTADLLERRSALLERVILNSPAVFR
jgi:secernin